MDAGDTPQPEGTENEAQQAPEPGREESAAGEHPAAEAADTWAPPTPQQAPPNPQQAPPPLPQVSQPAAQAWAPKPPGTFRRAFGWGAGIGTGLAVVITALSILSTISMVIGLVAVAATAGKQTTTTTTIWGSGDSTLRAIRIEGTILADGSDGGLLSSGTYGYQIASQIDSLTRDDSSGLVLLVNTPGGSISGSKAIADSITRYQERTDQKVFVHISEMSASGGVYSTAPADEIVADHGTLIGSIGVIMGPFSHYDGVTGIGSTLLASGVTTSGGITQEYFSAGTGKDFGNPFRTITDKERAHYQAGIDAEYAKFVEQVSTHRSIPADKIRNEFGAFLFDPDAAKANGLIDEVMGRDEFFRHAASAAGLDPDKTRVEAAVSGDGLAALLGVTQLHPVGQAPAVEQGEGITPALSRTICSGTQPLVFAGDLRTVCG